LKDIIKAFVKHVAAVSGATPTLTPAPDALQRLPTYFGSLYEAWKGDLIGHHYLFLVAKGREQPSPAEVAGHCRVAMKALNEPVAFVFAGLESFTRQRLIQHRVPFAVPRRQMYLPQFLTDLREGASPRREQAPGHIDHLSASAQALMLYHLQKPRALELGPLAAWARLLGYSAMTATRIASELAEAQLCNVTQSGRKTILDFDHDRLALWNKALPFLRSPVRMRLHVRFIEKGPMPWLQAGLPALSRHTMLADDGNAVVAMSAAEYERARSEERLQELPFADEDSSVVERWRYRPGLLSDGPTVDPLSLYLSLRGDQDERVHSALNELMDGVQW
jgi:hypothetical protein